jgi:hypothetical protein
MLKRKNAVLTAFFAKDRFRAEIINVLVFAYTIFQGRQSLRGVS